MIWRISQKICEGKDPFEVLQNSELVKVLIKNIISRDCIKYAREVFCNIEQALTDINDLSNKNMNNTDREDQEELKLTRGMSYYFTESPPIDFDMEEIFEERKSLYKTNDKLFMNSKAIIINDKKKYYEIIVNTTKQIWKLLLELVEFAPSPLKIIVSAFEKAMGKKKGSKEIEIRKLLNHIVLRYMLADILNNPIQYNIIDECAVSSTYYEIIADICKIMKSLFLGKRILPQEPLSLYANSFIISSQYFTFHEQARSQRVYKEVIKANRDSK